MIHAWLELVEEAVLPKSKEGTKDDPCWINGSRIVDVRVVFRGVFTFCRGGECSQGLNNQDCENSILQIVNNQPAHIQYLSGEMLFCYLLHACSRSYLVLSISKWDFGPFIQCRGFGLDHAEGGRDDVSPSCLFRYGY